jgi:hypothetical protein
MKLTNNRHHSLEKEQRRKTQEFSMLQATLAVFLYDARGVPFFQKTMVSLAPQLV